jgi:hypothetical protein
MNIKPIIIKLDNDVEINITSGKINDIQVEDDVFILRYLKTRYLTNTERFKEHFVRRALSKMKELNDFSDINVLKNMVQIFSDVKPFDFLSASKVDSTALRGIAFSEIDIEKVINKCGGKRINVEGIELPQRFYNEDGSYEIKNMSLVYELYEVDLSEIIPEMSLAYAVKCWCTSTNKAAFLWVKDEDAQKGPLHAIASLCYIWKDALNKKGVTLKRHGDIFIFETDEKVDCTGEIVQLDKETYFKLLCAQT